MLTLIDSATIIMTTLILISPFYLLITAYYFISVRKINTGVEKIIGGIVANTENPNEIGELMNELPKAFLTGDLSPILTKLMKIVNK